MKILELLHRIAKALESMMLSAQTNASETQQGLVQEATQTETNAGTAMGSTGARLFINPSKLAGGVGAVISNAATAAINDTDKVATTEGSTLKVNTWTTVKAFLKTYFDTLYVTATNTLTLTNKRITPRTGTTTSSATPTINTDNVDFFSVTALAVDITSFTTNLSGTPTEGQTLWIAITGTAARAITWGSSFEASTIALPTTTVTTNRLDIGFIWNTVSSKWRCVGTC